MSNKVYLDHAAATPLDGAVHAAMEQYFAEDFYNPSSVFLDGRNVARQLEAFRNRVAYWLGANSSEIYFTAGATEANNLALTGVIASHPTAKILVSAVEHASIMHPARQGNHLLLPVQRNGVLDAQVLERDIDDQTILVSIMYANNETGTIQPITDIAARIAIIRERRRQKGVATPIYLHTDAVQAAQYLDLHVDRLGVDLMTLSAGKIYGPKQVGVLYVRRGVTIAPLLLGGGQEHGLRSGTENVAGAAAMAAALSLVQSDRKQEAKRVKRLRDMLLAGVLKAQPHVEVVGDQKQRLANNICLLVPGADGERLVMELDERGIQCSTGSACLAQHENSASHVVQAMGYSAAQAAATLRFSLGRHTTEADIHFAVEQINAVVGIAL